MSDRMKLDETSTGISFQDRIFMVAGYLDEYLCPTTESEESTEHDGKTIHDLKDNKGYVDEEGIIRIYKEKAPGKAFDAIPWFTIEIDEESDAQHKYHFKYNPKKTNIVKSMWSVDRIKDLSVQNIIKKTTDEPLKYDEKVMMALARATSVITPKVESTDDFLKAIVKTTIIAKGVNVNKYKAKITPTWIVSNLVNGLLGTTKTGPVTFQSWMEMLGCNFEIRVYDNGYDPEDPLKHALVYNSETNKITEEGEKKDEDDSVRMARSVKA